MISILTYSIAHKWVLSDGLNVWSGLNVNLPWPQGGGSDLTPSRPATGTTLVKVSVLVVCLFFFHFEPNMFSHGLHCWPTRCWAPLGNLWIYFLRKGCMYLLPGGRLHPGPPLCTMEAATIIIRCDRPEVGFANICLCRRPLADIHFIKR